eukprot:EG_transcript_11602
MPVPRCPPPVLPPSKDWMWRWSGKRPSAQPPADGDIPALRPSSAPARSAAGELLECEPLGPAAPRARPASAAVRRPPSPAPSSLKKEVAAHRGVVNLEQLQRNKERTVRAEERLRQTFAARIRQLTHPCNVHRKSLRDAACGRCLLAELTTVEERCFGHTTSPRDTQPPPTDEPPKSPRPSKPKPAKGPAKSRKQRMKEREEEEARQRQLEDEQAERRLVEAAARNKQRNERYILLGLQRLQQPLLHRIVEAVEFPKLLKAVGFKGDPASYVGRRATVSAAVLASALASLVPADAFSARDVQTVAEMFTQDLLDAHINVSEVSVTFAACAQRHDVKAWLQYFHLCQVLTPALLDGNEPTVTPLELHTLAHITAEVAGPGDATADRLRRHALLSPAWQGKPALTLFAWLTALQQEDPELAAAFQPDWTLPFAPPNPQPPATSPPAPP